MGKNRKSKRQLIRDEKRAKKRERELAHDEERQAKRQRQHDDDAAAAEPVFDHAADFIPLDDGETATGPYQQQNGGGNFEREFFGLLSEQEQEYFRHADEMLELNDFPSPRDRALFLRSVCREARGRELKLAASQSCSRLMERLILLADAPQKKRLFGAFAGHFLTLVTHRFASHCCEKLFAASAAVVTEEMAGGGGGGGEMKKGKGEGQEQEGEEEEEEEKEEEVTEEMKMSMEELFLLTLDELEEHLSFLLSDRYGSHALRVLLVVLSGRPLDQAGTKSLLQGKNKEHITVEGAAANASELNSQTRMVPSSFTAAIEKIIGDSTSQLDGAALRVLAKHPTGNPTLQLLLDLELSYLAKSKKAKKDGEEKRKQDESGQKTLLERLVPDAPASFADEKSQACEFVNGMLYDPIGSRLLETLIAHCPGRIFKGLNANIFGPRIQSLLRNDIASYPAIKVLNRLSKEDLASAVQKCLPEISSYVERGRLNVVKTLMERCSVRNATAELGSLLQAVTTACGGHWKHLVPKLCLLNDEPEPEPEPESKQNKKFQPPDAKNKSALVSHGSQVVSAMLAIPGQPSKAIQTSLISLSSDHLLRLATSSAATSAILTKSLSVPAQVAHFHKLLVAALLPNINTVATSQHGSAIVNAIIAAPSRSSDASAAAVVVPFHLKENIMAQLERHEQELRATWLGRNVWRTWRGDLWSHRRHDWVRWAKETDPEGERVSKAPAPRAAPVANGEGKGREKKKIGGKENGETGSKGNSTGKDKGKKMKQGEKEKEGGEGKGGDEKKKGKKRKERNE
ncbi:hypothetical protein VTK26DRAFT_329 [Humicola hyalothermophila]